MNWVLPDYAVEWNKDFGSGIRELTALLEITQLGRAGDVLK